MNLIPSSAFIPAALPAVVLAGLVLFLSARSLSAAPPLPLPDAVEFTAEAKLPPGVKERLLPCSIISEDEHILVVETSTKPGVIARLSLDKTLIAQVQRGDPSLRPFAEMEPDLALPPESREAAYYDDKIDRLFRPFLKKFPNSPRAEAVRAAEKSYSEELQRVASGEFRDGQRWTLKSLLTPVDLKAVQLLQQARKNGVDLPVADFKKLVDEARLCFASEFFPNLGRTLQQIGTARLAKLKAAEEAKATAETPAPGTIPAPDPNAPKPPAADDPKKDELAALIPINGWNWDDMDKAIALSWEAETKLKNSPPDQISVSLDLLRQSHALMPWLLARERILREQANAYSAHAIEEAKADHRFPATSWWHAALQLAAQLPPPENQDLSDTFLVAFEKSFSDQAAVALQRREYEDSKAWYQSMIELMSKTPAASRRLPEMKKRLGDLDALLKSQIKQQTIDNVRKALAGFLAAKDFEGAKLTLATRWEEIQKLRPSPQEYTIFAHAALDQAEAAFKSFKVITGCQLIVLAQHIAPKDPRVKTWIFGSSMTLLALLIFLLLPLLWLFARSGIILENLRYRFRLKGLRKKNPKGKQDLGNKR